MTDGTAHDAHHDAHHDADASDDLAERERLLTERGDPYARATVVRREPPVSANVGDRAVVTADGDLFGWVGGASCAQSTVIREARAAIADGKPRLLGLAPDPEDVARPGLDAFPMTCHSEGTLEVFVEPVIPATQLLVVGDSPVARSLARLAPELDVTVTVVDPDGASDEQAGSDATTVLTTLDPGDIAAEVGSGPFVVVASMGKYDARGVAAGVLADAPYIGLVASSVRATEVVERAAGLLDSDPETIRDAVTTPAGLDIDAHTGSEIAVSILAELIDVRASVGAVTASGSESARETESCCSGGDHDNHHDAETTEAADASDGPHIDPVCGMTVEPEGAPSVTHEGQTYYFCCQGCADSFSNDPDEYLDADEGRPAHPR
ncbi:XdhC family protein [Haloferax namakaokahaiae]|uniref:XdhC family protein n=1 Tax=Haloferax namakaokahaiae TaxID=1748331 RepID=A0ABD5ZJ49_9EURY